MSTFHKQSSLTKPNLTQTPKSQILSTVTHTEKAQMLKGVYSNQEIKPKVNNHSNIKQHTHHKTTKAQKGILQPIPNSTQSQISYLYANSAQPHITNIQNKTTTANK